MSERPVKYHWIITLQKPAGVGGINTVTRSGTVDATAGPTRSAVYDQIRKFVDQEVPELKGGNVMFWSLE
ncbi:hypothetical protein, partial [Marinitenerispora sediminis]|uniref:hypothetical protein n=1 Tax=Marinitenerispora sediminis TaxID=1931232 RepID=UPI000DFA67A4